MPFSNVQEKGRPLTIKDEGVDLTTNASSIDLVGSGVVGTNSGDAVTQTIGGIPSGALVTLTGTINDTNTTFTSTSEPTVLIINGGMYQQSGGSITWTYDAGTIELSQAVGDNGAIYGIS